VPPSEVVDAARAYVGHALRQHPVEVQEQGTDLVYVDPRLTTAALAHLLENAAAYSPAGSPITVTAGTTSEGLSLTVRDRGPGISAQDLPHLFDRFYRGTAAQGRPGSGMGLAIARGLLAVEGGRVWAENAPDGGALFSLAVAAPTRHAESIDDERESVSERATRPPSLGSTFRPSSGEPSTQRSAKAGTERGAGVPASERVGGPGAQPPDQP
jgi:signal transduction histidine kinase